MSKNDWNPIRLVQTEQLQSIHAHMTEIEKRKFNREILPTICLITLLVAFGASLSVSNLLGSSIPSQADARWQLPVILMIGATLSIFLHFWIAKRALCRTEWAQEQNKTPNSLHFFRWPGRDPHADDAIKEK
ncbi:MAG TPA: hypothetical protein PLJ47_04600 [Candidatus Hydrogenedentes bacterium]|nr:hypothetical protein [Candidatus Hydrogenedentota bacterium]HRK33856.1 hypothetical protein [Candidatus Hydrogenedentota bacterium]